MTPILQSHLPFIPWLDPRTARLPGILPVDGEDWLRVDDAFAAQMAERDRLIAGRPEAVHGLTEAARPAAAELYDLVLERLRATPGYRIDAGQAIRPDGVAVPLNRAAPLLTLGRLVQEDLCLMESDGAAEAAEHVLTGAILCFPASWTLAQKLGRPMSAIHVPAHPYTADVGRRVQRMMDAIRPGQALWRMNYLTYADPTLHAPRPENDPRPRPAADLRLFLRAERQCLVRLPQTRAVLFSIHTYMVRVADLPDEARLALLAEGH